MSENHTTVTVQRCLDALAGETPADPLIRALLDRAVGRLEMLCASMLYRAYPRLTRPPLCLDADEVLGAVVERLLKSMHAVRPRTVREFFALANQHMRWELNDLARRLDERPAAVELDEGQVPAQASSVYFPNSTGYGCDPCSPWRRAHRSASRPGSRPDWARAAAAASRSPIVQPDPSW